MIQIDNLGFSYAEGLFRFVLPRLSIGRGEVCCITGPSGYGKTTLLSLIAGILVPADGVIQVDGLNLPELSEKERRQFRLEKIGFVFQDLELLDYLNVYENIGVGRFLDNSRVWNREAIQNYDQHIRELAARTGIERHLNRHPAQLSRGEKQRVALCRSLVNSPVLILADEATGSLDPENREKTRDLLYGYCRETGATLVEASHDRSGLENFDRIFDLPAIAEILPLEEQP
ncbi:MAG: ATP-binding cassette domain-containing protein [Spirochaetales bacterium]|nr:ATP-binding cassette domain-containing protein [Spirochaetales bacterium]